MSLFPRALAPFFIAVLCVIVPTGALAATGGGTTAAATGGTAYQEEPPPPPMTTPGLWTGQEVPGDLAQLLPDGTAAAPANAPEQVKQAIWAANALRNLPYVYGGGHNAKFSGKGYDCSGTVSFALHGAGLLKMPLDSGSFMRWGMRGKGRWITIFTNPGHAYAIIAGLRLDTSVAGMSRTLKGFAASAFESGPRWRPLPRSARGFVRRHPLSF
jgi:hypothetical protein